MIERGYRTFLPRSILAQFVSHGHKLDHAGLAGHGDRRRHRLGCLRSVTKTV
jgi:hypothetical protein